MLLDLGLGEGGEEAGGSEGEATGEEGEHCFGELREGRWERGCVRRIGRGVGLSCNDRFEVHP